MQNLTTTSLRIRENQLWILDQQALPQRADWRECRDVSELVDHIRTLRVRGAPLIGLSASLLLALLAGQGMTPDQLHHALETLRASRPTAVNLMNNLDRMKAALQHTDYVKAAAEEALRLVEEDRALCDSIAAHGATLVSPGSRLLTHCNTGGLATAGVGTAIGVIRLAHEQGHVAQVWVDETRPLLQGGRLTAWELGELGIPYQLICDSMAASLMAQKQVDAIWVGADRIAANGDVVAGAGLRNRQSGVTGFKCKFGIVHRQVAVHDQIAVGHTGRRADGITRRNARVARHVQVAIDPAKACDGAVRRGIDVTRDGNASAAAIAANHQRAAVHIDAAGIVHRTIEHLRIARGNGQVRGHDATAVRTTQSERCCQPLLRAIYQNVSPCLLIINPAPTHY